jgi:hypothetical protein
MSMYPSMFEENNEVKGGLTGFVPGTVRRRDSYTYRSELVEYIWDKLESTYKTTTLER